MQLKVFSTLVFVSLAAALALPQAPPPDKGTPVRPLPKNLPPPPSSSPPPPPPKTGIPPANTPVPQGPNTHQGKANDGDKPHVPRADVDPKKELPPFKGLPLPKTDLPPPPKMTDLPPPPPKTGIPPASSPLPPSPNTHQGKANGDDKSHLPRADVIPPPKKVLPPPPKKVLPPPAKTPVPGPVKAPKV